MEFIKEYWFNIIFFTILGYTILNFIRHGGIKNALFGGKITKTYGEVAAEKRSGMSQIIKIHKIESAGKELIGLEITSKSIASWHMQPLTISKQEAQNLIMYLQNAINQ